MIYHRIIFLCIIIFKKLTTSNGITTRLDHSSHTSYRRHIGTLSTNDWEPGLREATYQALLRENNREPTLRDQIYYAPLEGRQDSAIPFGDIIILARGQLYSTYNGFKFVQDPYPNDCDDCHNGRIKCAPSQCKGWNPATGEQLVALWTVKRIRHRDAVYGHRYELEYTLSPISAVVNSGYRLEDGGFDYNLPGHVFIIRSDPNGEKYGFDKATTTGTTWFNSNYVNLDGKKDYQHNRNVYKTTEASSSSGDQEIEIYKELIKSLAMKTSTSLKPVGTSAIYSDIFDATIQKIPVTMIHQQTSSVPAQKDQSTTTSTNGNTIQTTQTQITSVWTTPLVAGDENVQTTKPIRFPSTPTKTTRYSEPDPLYHSTTPSKGIQQTSKPPITTITFFAPDDSITENDIFGRTQTTKQNTPLPSTTVTAHTDIFDAAHEDSIISSTIASITRSSFTTNAIAEETTTTTKRPTIVTRIKSTTTEQMKKPSRRTRKPFVPNRTTARTTQKPRAKPTRRRTTTTSAEFDEVFFEKVTTTTKPTTISVSQSTKSTTPSIFDIPVENDSEEVEDNEEITSASSDVTSRKTEKVTTKVETTTEFKIASVTEGATEESQEVATKKDSKATTVVEVDESSLTTPSSEKYTEPVIIRTSTVSAPNKTTVKVDDSSITTSTSPRYTKSTQTTKVDSFQTTPNSSQYTKSDTPTTKTPLTTTLSIKNTETETTDKTTAETDVTTFEVTTTIKTTPIVFVGTIITKKPTVINLPKSTTPPAKRNKKPTKNDNKHEDIYDIFGEAAPSVLEKPTTEKQSKATITDDFLFGSEIKNPVTTTKEPVVIFDNFFEASTFSSNETDKYSTTITTQLENNTEEIKTEAEPLTSMSYITSISFQVNGKNVTTTKQPTNSTNFEPMIKAKVKEIATNANDFKIFKAEMPESNQTNAKQQFDHIALSLINHARSINILDNNNNTSNTTKTAKYKRRSYTPRRGRRRKVRREKMN